MKTGEEKFDDEIRQKLRHSEVKPPAGLFDVIVPPPDKKRWFLWIWAVGVLILGTTAMMMYNHSSFDTTLSKSKSSVNAINGTSSIHKISSAPASNESAIIGEDSKAEHSINNSNEDNNSTIARNKKGENESNRNDSYNSDSNINTPQKEKKFKSTNKAQDPVFVQKNGSSGNTNIYSGKTESNADLIYNYDHLYYPVISLPYTEKDFTKQPTKIFKKDSLELITHIPSKFSLELYASQVYFYSKISSGTGDTLANRLLNSRPEESLDSKGIDIGIKVKYSLNKRFSVSAGLNYSNRNEEFNFNFTDYYKSTQIDTIQYFVLFPFSTPLLVTDYDSTILTKSRVIPIQHDINFNVISLSGEIRYEIPVGRFVIEPQVGLIMDLFSQKKGNTNFNPEFENVSGKDYYKQNMQTRIKGGIQLGYSLGEKIDLLFNSEYQYALNKMETSQPFYTEKINRISFGAGVRYNIFKSQATKAN